MSERRINIGCGPYSIRSNGFINIDINPLHRPDVLRDVRRGLPFDDCSCDEIVTSHFLEHLASDDLIFLIGEIYRVSKPKAQWRVVVPLGNTGDLDHKTLFDATSFDCFERPETADYFQLPAGARWEIISRRSGQEPTRPAVCSLSIVLRAVKG